MYLGFLLVLIIVLKFLSNFINGMELNNSIKLITTCILLNTACSNLLCSIDSNDLTFHYSIGFNRAYPSLFKNRQSIPWDGNSTNRNNQLKSSSNSAIFSMGLSSISPQLEIGFNLELHSKVNLSLACSYHKCNISVYRFDYDSTYIGKRYGITINGYESKFPSEYRLSYKFLNFPFMLNYKSTMNNKNIGIFCGFGLQVKSIIGNAIDVKQYFRSWDSGKFNSGVNILQEKKFGIAPVLQCGIACRFNKQSQFYIYSRIEDFYTGYFQRVTIIDDVNHVYYSNVVNSRIALWSFGIGFIKRIS